MTDLRMIMMETVPIGDRLDLRFIVEPFDPNHLVSDGMRLLTDISNEVWEAEFGGFLENRIMKWRQEQVGFCVAGINIKGLEPSKKNQMLSIASEIIRHNLVC